MEEIKLLKKIIEEEEAFPAPARFELGESYYEFDVDIGEHGKAIILIRDDDYFNLMEDE